MKPIYFCLIVVSFIIAGCPAPDNYVLLDDKETYLSATPGIITKDFEAGAHGVYPGYDTKKRVIIFDAWVKNKSAEDLKFVLSNNLIVTPTDTLQPVNYKGPLINDVFRNENDTVLIPQGQTKHFHVFFISRKTYTRHEYGKTKRREHIQLQLNLFNRLDTTIRLVFKPTKYFTWQK